MNSIMKPTVGQSKFTIIYCEIRILVTYIHEEKFGGIGGTSLKVGSRRY